MISSGDTIRCLGVGSIRCDRRVFIRNSGVFRSTIGESSWRSIGLCGCTGVNVILSPFSSLIRSDDDAHFLGGMESLSSALIPSNSLYASSSESRTNLSDPRFSLESCQINIRTD